MEIKNLQNRFQMSVQQRPEFITIRHFNQAMIDRVMINKKMILELRNRITAQLLVRDSE